MKSQNKKLWITTIIGIATLVLLVAGATFAYFSVPIQNNYSKTKITSKIDSIGNVTLMPGSELAMELTGAQMMNMGEVLLYYGSSEGTTQVETTEVIGTASVTGNGVFTCTYDLTMNATGENNMYDAVQSMSNNVGQVRLTVNGVQYDFSEANLFPKTIKGEMTGLTEGVSQDITAQLMLINHNTMVQNELIGTDIEITFELDNFNCTVTEMGEIGSYVMATSPENISTELVEGLYRYQGTEEEVTNNYVCFGTDDKDACLASPTDYLHRIIGITPDGQLKLIKIIDDYAAPQAAWHTPSGIITDKIVSWPYSTLFTTVNTNPYADSWTAMIVDKEWKYGDWTAEKYNEFQQNVESMTSLEEVYGFEKDFKNTVAAKYGLMNVTDWFNTFICKTGDSYSCSGGWIYRSNTSSSTEHEWMLTKIGYVESKGVQYGLTDGLSYDTSLANKYSYRPVFYIDSDFDVLGTGVNVTMGGSGTPTDPYIAVVEE